jgi:hypothetical protein
LPPKLVTLNNALLAVMDPEGIANRVTDPARFGTWVEFLLAGSPGSALPGK